MEGAQSPPLDRLAWLRSNLRCPVCGGSDWQSGPALWLCLSCGSGRPIENRAVSFIEPELAEQTRVNVVSRISAHAYSSSTLALIESAKRAGGMVLDCGAGSRAYTAANLIQTEITPYDNIDVLAVNQRLPFADESFDIVLSYDVLEHVTDPFSSARELARVLKPGGILHVNVPFLQTEHGYPHHYYNMTRQGLLNLFRGQLDCEAHVVPRSGSAQATAWYVLTAVRGGMTKQQRPEFEAMTVGDLLAMTPKDLARRFPIAEFADWQAASATQALFRKGGAARLDIKASDLPVFQALTR